MRGLKEVLTPGSKKSDESSSVRQQTEQKPDWREEFKEDYMLLKGLGREAYMLGKHAKQDSIVRRTVRGLQAGIGKDVDEDMNIDVGRKEIVHNYPSKTPALTSALLAGALVAGGTALPFLWNALKPNQQQTVVDTDTDTREGITLGLD